MNIHDRSFLTSGEIVKQNPARIIRRVTDEDGVCYYIKHDTPKGFWKRLLARIRRKSRSEYKSALLLKKYHIPCIEYVALHEELPESFLVSQELKDHIPAVAFWEQASPEDRERFVRSLCHILRSLNENHLLHPDFHAGNIMCRENDPDSLILIDPFGIRKSFRDPAEQNCGILLSFVQQEEGEKLLREVAPGRDISWEKLLADRRSLVASKWDARQKQILSGKSKFCRTECIDGVTFHIRNSSWYTPLPFTPENCTTETVSPEEGKAIWLDSFHRELMLLPVKRPAAIAWKKDQAILYYDL